MQERLKQILNWILKGSSLIVLLLIICCLSLTIIILKKCAGDSNSDNISIENTPSAIISILPKNEIYVATAVIEDYTSKQATEYHLGFFPEEHSCVQVLRQKVSYKVNLADVKYNLREDGKMEVTMPEPVYTASTQASPFISDNEEFWSHELTSTNSMKRKVEMQIRERFDTRENKDKARIYAEEAISHILSQLGYEAIFVPKSIESKKE